MSVKTFEEFKVWLDSELDKRRSSTAEYKEFLRSQTQQTKDCRQLRLIYTFLALQLSSDKNYDEMEEVTKKLHSLPCATASDKAFLATYYFSIKKNNEEAWKIIKPLGQESMDSVLTNQPIHGIIQIIAEYIRIAVAVGKTDEAIAAFKFLAAGKYADGQQISQYDADLPHLLTPDQVGADFHEDYRKKIKPFKPRW